MKQQKAIIFLFVLLINITANAQNVNVTKTAIKKVGDNVAISFDVMVDDLPANYMLTLTPTLWNGDKQQPLKQIVVMNRTKSITQSRKGSVTSGILTYRSKEMIPYSVTIPFEPWMGGVSLRIDKTLKGCCKRDYLSPMLVTSNSLTPIIEPIIPLFVSDVQAAYIDEFKKQIKGLPFVHHIGKQHKNNYDGLAVGFEQGSTTIDLFYMDNENILQKIKESIEMIKAESDIELIKIRIEGGASPEGSFELNQKLGKGRADAVISIISEWADSALIEVDNIGENWDKLYHMVEKSDMMYKSEVLSIIDNYSIHNGRELRLMNLRGGVPYNYMYKTFFTKLRTASYVQVFYDIKPSDELIKIDRASKLIILKNYKEALDILKDVTLTPYTNNLIGVCYMMTEDIVNARISLQKAIEGGNIDAENNLIRLDYQQNNIQYK